MILLQGISKWAQEISMLHFQNVSAVIQPSGGQAIGALARRQGCATEVGDPR